MTKSDLVNEICVELNLKKKDVESVCTAAFDCIARVLSKGDEVRIMGFGTFKRKERKARLARNPRNGESIEVKASQYPSFTPGKTLKEIVSGQSAHSQGAGEK